MSTARPAMNPLARAACAVPVKAAGSLSAAARVLAAGVALLVAVDQTYDPSEVFAPAVAALLLLTVLPLWGRADSLMAGAGTSLAFFTGAVLFNVFVGWLMIPLGVLAMAAVLVRAYQRGESVPVTVLTLFSGAPVIAVLVAAVVLTVDG